MIESTPSLPPYPSPAKSKGEGEPVLTSKWTIVNDEWVEAQFLLARGKSGLSDCPADNRALGANTESVK